MEVYYEGMSLYKEIESLLFAMFLVTLALC